MIAEDLSTLSTGALRELAADLRRRIIEVMSVNGGHLSSNLGIVELTIALHRVFSSPRDKFIFDVSHQAYPHKLLTGRDAKFDQIRKYKGLCGFTHPQESPHDHFFAGHAGTALSLALGVAKTRSLRGSSEHILPILGDASLSCGLTLEALNNVPRQTPRFLAILNDNAMSIAKNVGHIKDILERLDTGRFSKGSSSFFEDFGFSYRGPVDGHDLDALIETLESLKNLDYPVLLHVITVKGKGMPIAVANPTPYHGVRPFDLCSGKFLPSASTRPTFPKIFGKHLLAMAQKDPSLICITPATSTGSCLDELMEQLPGQCIDVGIAEGHAVSFAGGLALGGTTKVVACIYATFIQRALDNVFQDVCMQGLPVVFALDRSFLSGPDGSTHHGIYDLSFLNAMPHMVIAQPRDGHVLKELLESSFSWKKPCAIRYPNLETEEPIQPLVFRPIGRAELLSTGKQILLIGLGHMCQTAFLVKKILASYGVDAAIADPIFVKPLDEQFFHEIIPHYPYVATLEEHALHGGFGMIFNHFLMTHRYGTTRVLNFGIPDAWVQFGSHGELIQELSLDAPSIARRILEEWIR